MRRSAVAFIAASLGSAAFAQLVPRDPDWRELHVPPPPRVRTEGLVPIDMGGSALRWGIDPASVGLGPDRVVRYVVVAQSRSGAVNAMYEGILCDRGEYRVFARHTPGQGWRAVEGDWKSLKEGLEAVHVRAVARAGVCLGHSPSGTSAAQIVRNLGATPDRMLGGRGAP